MADLITRPDSRPDRGPAASPESLAERLLDTQAPQRPQSTPRIRIEVDPYALKIRVLKNNHLAESPQRRLFYCNGRILLTQMLNTSCD